MLACSRSSASVSSLGIYSVILAGWASNSKYPFLGGVRASAQLISYELSMTLAVIPVFLWINAPGEPGTMSLAKVVEFQSQPGGWGGAWFLFTMPICALDFSRVAVSPRLTASHSTCRSRDGADLVGGFHTEYGAFKWSLFFVAEYSHMIIGSGVFTPRCSSAAGIRCRGCRLRNSPRCSVLRAIRLLVALLSMLVFLGKVVALLFFFMWVRWTVPRFRYDQVMKLGWQKLLPLSIANLLAYAIGIAVLQKINVHPKRAMAIIPFERKPLSLAERTYLPAIAAGLKITFKHIFQPKVTLEYPEERPTIPAGYRGVPTLVRDPNGREKCVSCPSSANSSARQRPSASRPGKSPPIAPTGHVEKKAPKEFDIDMLRAAPHLLRALPRKFVPRRRSSFRTNTR